MSGNLRDALNPTAAIVLPLAWAGVAGVGAAVLGGSIAWANQAQNPLATAGIVGGITFCGAWLRSMSWFGGTVAQLVGKPAPAPQPYPAQVRTFRLDIRWNDGAAGDWADSFGVTWEQLQAWFVGVHQGRSLGENHWTGSKNPFSKGEYHAMLDRLRFYGIIRLAGKHYTSGYTLTSKGQAVAREMARRHDAQATPYPSGMSYHQGVN